MTVFELITELQKHPEDLPVIAIWEGQGVEFNAEHITVEDGELKIDVDTWGKA